MASVIKQRELEELSIEVNFAEIRRFVTLGGCVIAGFLGAFFGARPGEGLLAGGFASLLILLAAFLVLVVVLRIVDVSLWRSRRRVRAQSIDIGVRAIREKLDALHPGIVEEAQEIDAVLLVDAAQSRIRDKAPRDMVERDRRGV